MRTALLSREYPPFVYGGGGVHVGFLVEHLRRRGVDVRVQCMGEPRDGATAHGEHDARLAGANPALGVFSTDTAIAAAVTDVDVVHSHTWYTNLAGHWAKLLHGIPHVVTAHSLEPMRPWKAEQLGGGYRLSSWAERTAFEAADAVIAVSRSTRHDVLACYPGIDPARVHVIGNGIDTDAYHPDPGDDVLRRIGVDPTRPYVAFVGRTTRQKGVPHLLRAGLRLHPRVQLVLLAGAADTPELAAEVGAAVDDLAAVRDGVFLVPAVLPPEEVRQVLSHAVASCCPSVYEPLGIVNLEAMACGTAVVASAVGGIPEVVDHGVTGTLVPLDRDDPEAFERDLAAALDELAADPARAARMGRAGRARAVAEFGWAGVAERTHHLYEALAGGPGRPR
ncbi:glycogen synthase [Kineococcus glutinatus]|uniref:Glycogen synthase n=1 Tax=Kineococcus glutinatus TaxID=1070872 RepID=A0ABP9I4W4_9ACTN